MIIAMTIATIGPTPRPPGGGFGPVVFDIVGVGVMGGVVGVIVIVTLLEAEAEAVTEALSENEGVADREIVTETVSEIVGVSESGSLIDTVDDNEIVGVMLIVAVLDSDGVEEASEETDIDGVTDMGNSSIARE